MNDYLARINFSGNLETILSAVCSEFKIGQFKNFRVVEIGYEDLNIILTTDLDRYFVKIFSSFRDFTEIKRYVKVMLEIIKAGINHPKLFQCSEKYIYSVKNSAGELSLVVMEYIPGHTFFGLQSLPDINETREIIRQVTLINKSNLEPEFEYDSWAIVNFLKEFAAKKSFLSQEDLDLLNPIAAELENMNINSLPQTFCHGDILTTNVIKAEDDKLYIIDFSCSNFQPRIVELAVLLCNLFFDDKNPTDWKIKYDFVLNEYCKYIELVEEELKLLPLFLKVAHGIHVLNANYERVVNNNLTDENNHWYNIGKVGLKTITD